MFFLTIKLHQTVKSFPCLKKKYKVHGGPYIDATGLGPWHLANGPCQRARRSARGTLEEKIIACVGGSSQLPIASMYGIFAYIYHTNQPNVGKYTIYGLYGLVSG